jgi:hypothetical protein
VAPIVGLDGGVGLPGYSGLLPNPMLANSLVTVRDLLLSGSASNGLKGGVESVTQRPSGSSENRVKRLQPNVRAALIEMELLEALDFGPPAGTVVDLKLRSPSVSLMKMSVPDRSVFVSQLDFVHSFADLRGERINEILVQVVPQTAYWCSIAGMTPERHRYTLELLGAGLRFAMLVVMRLKHEFNAPRPMELSALVQPVILTPGYTAFPSGHATEAYFAAELLAMLLAEADGAGGAYEVGPPTSAVGLAGNAAIRMRSQLLRLAYRIAENRVVAGLHYPVDSLAGQVLGITLARYFAARALGREAGVGACLTDAVFEGSKTDIVKGAEPVLDAPFDSRLSPQPTKSMKIATGPVLKELWNLACAEWKP